MLSERKNLLKNSSFTSFMMTEKVFMMTGRVSSPISSWL
jgi:hypothetical protein